MGDTYTHGHHESVLRSHRWRTAENSAGYLLSSLEPGLDLLDVGCGPGTITLDLAAIVAPGNVVGLDAAAEVIALAQEELAQSSVTNVSFRTGDVYALDYPDSSFDVVHVHQMLQHLTDPVRALAEMRRVLRPGGLLAVRESDFGALVWAPADPVLDRWMELYYQIVERNNAQADAGRLLLGWVQAVGFDDITTSSSNWTYADPGSRAWWGNLWADRVEHSRFGEQAIAYGLCEREELTAIGDAWRRWSQAPNGFFSVMSAEILARR